jgi:hypothetical protein
MKLTIYKTSWQFAVTPYIKVTYSRTLNGDYELIIGWLKYEISVSV